METIAVWHPFSQIPPATDGMREDPSRMTIMNGHSNAILFDTFTGTIECKTVIYIRKLKDEQAEKNCMW